MRNKVKSKYFFYAVLFISILSLAAIFFIGSFSGVFLSKSYYDALYEKTGAYDRLERHVVENKTLEIFGFFLSKNNLDSEFFTQNEISHMNDVKELIKKVFLAYYAALFLFLMATLLIFYFQRQEFSVFLKKSLFYSGIATIVFALMFFLFSFSNIFEYFHRIFFVSNYSFPATSNLIKMFNEEFFYLFAKRILIVSLIKGFIAAAAGGYLIFRKNR